MLQKSAARLVLLFCISLLVGAAYADAPTSRSVPTDDAVIHQKDIAAFKATLDRLHPSPSQEALHRLEQWVTAHPNDLESATLLARAYLLPQFGADPHKAWSLLQPFRGFRDSAVLEILGYGDALGYSGPNERMNGIALIKEAAEQGSGPAATLLGKLYMSTLGPKQDLMEAQKYFTLAVKLGDSHAYFCFAQLLHFFPNNPEGVALSRKLLETGAQAGDPYAEYDLALAKLSPGPDRNVEEGMEWMKRSAEWGLPIAQYLIGTNYKVGILLNKNPREAGKWIHLAADAHWGDAEFEMAVANLDAEEASSYMIEPHKDEGIPWLERAARDESGDGQCLMGEMYLTGIGVKKDVGRGTALINAAAQQKKPIPEARFLQKLMGVSLKRSEPTTQPIQLAQTPETHRAEMKQFVAWEDQLQPQPDQHALDRLIQWVDEHPDDLEASVALASAYRLSNFGSVDLRGWTLLGRFRKSKDPRVVEILAFGDAMGAAGDSAQANGVHVLERCVEAGSATAMTALGHLYDYGIHLPKDAEKAVECYLKAIKLGDRRAYWQLAAHYYHRGDQEKYLQYIRQGAEAGDPEAEWELGVALAKNLTAKTLAEAVELLRKSEESGLPAAQFNYAQCMLKGTCVAKDPAKARTLCQLAAENHDNNAAMTLANAYLGIEDEFGFAFRPDRDAGFKWLKVAGGANDKTALSVLAVLYLSASESQPKYALEWLKESASSNLDARILCSLNNNIAAR